MRMWKKVIRHLYFFLHNDLSRKHFHQHALRRLVRGGAVGRAVPRQLTATLLTLATSEPDAVLRALEADEQGLTPEQVESRRQLYGPNEVKREAPRSWWFRLWLSYYNPFSVLLTLLAVTSLVTHDPQGATVIGSMIVLATSLRFIQENRSGAAADKLRAMVSNTVRVVRRGPPAGSGPADGEENGSAGALGDTGLDVPVKELVPGDSILLAAGDMVPADIRILTAKELFVNQAMLTGEALPVEKSAQPGSHKETNALVCPTLCFMGTNVVSGTAKAVVLATGKNTYFGTLAEQITTEDRSPTQFQAGINTISWLLLRFMMVMVPVVLFLNGFTKGDWVEASLFALSIAVGLTPEMLPLIVTSTLAKGAVILSKQKVIVKRLESIQNFGAMNILCTDKTGTLTQGTVELVDSVDSSGSNDSSALELAYVNSLYQTGLRNLLDAAVIEYVRRHKEYAPRQFVKVDEIPFDFMRRRMSVVLSGAEPGHMLVCKGAVEQMLAVCSQVRAKGAVCALTPERMAAVRATATDLNQKGFRLIAVAQRMFTSPHNSYGVADEHDLTLAGFISFIDPPKESAPEVLRALRSKGVDVKILTGDSELVTLNICRQVGLEVRGLVLGGDTDALDDAALTAQAEAATVLARLSPLQKERIVRLLREKGHVVGYMGDGINDAPALHAADIGISVNSAVDIAKEAADIILLEKSLMVLEAGVTEGRKIFANMLKYIKMTASSNFGNVFSVLAASVFIPFLPMLPLHLLVQNLLYDFSQIVMPFDNVDEEALQKPQRWNPGEVGRFMVCFGPISSVFDIITFMALWYIFGADSPERQTLFQSGWFIEGMVTQTCIVHILRTGKIPFLQSRASWPVCLATVSTLAVAVFLPMGPLASSFKLQALPGSYFVMIACIVCGYVLLTQAVKSWYSRRYGWQ